MEQTTLGQRLALLADSLKISTSKIAKECGFDRQSIHSAIKSNKGLAFENIQKMLNRYKKLNARWLICGEMPMWIGTDEESNKLNEKLERTEPKCKHCEDKQKIIDALIQGNDALTKAVNNLDLLVKKCMEELKKFHNSDEKRKAV